MNDPNALGYVLLVVVLTAIMRSMNKSAGHMLKLAGLILFLAFAGGAATGSLRKAQGIDPSTVVSTTEGTPLLAYGALAAFVGFAFYTIREYGTGWVLALAATCAGMAFWTFG